MWECDGSIDVVHSIFRSMQRERSGIFKCAKGHASPMEAHHASSCNARKTILDMTKRVDKFD